MISYLNSLIKAVMLDGNEVVSPLYEGISMVGPYAISIVGVLSLF